MSKGLLSILIMFHHFAAAEEEDGLDVATAKDIFLSPLGPPSIDDAEFEYSHDGGEVIYSLENGLLGYLLITAAGGTLDLAQVAIVFDPATPEGIENGYSCMTCHERGLLPKDDAFKIELERFKLPNAKISRIAFESLVRRVVAEGCEILMDSCAPPLEVAP